MPKYFLRVEAVNLANVIDDTDDLSTRRGGGLMVLNAAKKVEEELKKKPLSGFASIATGASVGLFAFEADDQLAHQTAEELRKLMNEYGTLEYENREDSNKTEHLHLKYATFVVAIQKVEGSEQASEQTLVAANRWEQLHTPSLSLEGLWTPTKEACSTDKIRPADSGHRLPKHRNEPRTKHFDISNSVFQRHQYGRYARQKFYKNQEVGEGLEFTNEFSEIAAHPNGDQHPLNNKLCVFYVDGNKFGSKGRDKFRSGGASAFKQWSDGLQAHHRTLLKALIERTRQDETWQNAGSIRLETLLWGGDEIIWVVPAWKGWELAKWFFSEKHKVGDEQLSYSCGLVFCNAKAPIQNIIKLAKDGLAELVKTYLKKVEKNLIAYEVLESFDDIPNNLEAHRKRWLAEGTDATALLLDPSKFKWDSLKSLAQNKSFPRRQLYRYVKAWRSGDEVAKTNALKRLREADTDKQLEEFIQGQEVNYLHLLQMMPYMPEYYS